jgi:hypothetical protein
MKAQIETIGSSFGMAALFGVLLVGCVPGYIKANELEQRNQGPTACAKSCQDLGMRMVAMVLVGDTLPGCVCQVLQAQSPAPNPENGPITAPPAAAPASAPPAVAPSSALPGTAPAADALNEGASASASGYVVIAAAAAARQQQAQQEQQRQQQLQTK